MSSEASRGPVFLLTHHRGGGTVLARVLNCHPELVIWGEHAGLINRLAEMDEMARRVEPLMAPKTDAAVAEFTAFLHNRLNEFDPWANPFDYEDFRRSCRAMIEGIFTRGVRPGQRWGFKEIRYHRALVARFLASSFPDAQFIVLSRKLADVAVSAILAPWSLRWLGDAQTAMPVAMAEGIVLDVAYALLAIERGLDDVRAVLGSRCLSMTYESSLEGGYERVAPLFAFLGLTVAEETKVRINRVLNVRVGATDRHVRFRDTLSAEFIRTRLSALAPALRAEIARNGIDRQRLIATVGTGQYSFLAGDHMMREGGSGFSSLF